MNDFEKQRKQIREKIWSLVQIKSGEKVLDVGIGDDAHSVKKLIDLGASVTTIDIDLRMLKKHKGFDINFIQCNASRLPFKSSVFDLSVAYFTLHEIDPNLHLEVLLELTRVSKKVMTVEPELGKDPLYSVYQNLWNRAMHSVGKFEDYQSITYWKTSLEKCGANIVTCKKVAYKKKLKGVEADKFMKGVIEVAKNYGVSERYVSEFRDLAEDIKRLGMRFSDICVVIGNVS